MLLLPHPSPHTSGGCLKPGGVRRLYFFPWVDLQLLQMDSYGETFGLEMAGIVFWHYFT